MPSAASKFLRQRPRDSRYLHAGFAAAAILILSLGAVLWHASGSMRDAGAWVFHTMSILDKASAFHARVLSAEAAQRGFLLTGADEYTQERDRSIVEARETLRQLRAMTRDNIAQGAQLDEVERLLDARVAAMALPELARREDGIESARTLFSNDGAVLATRLDDALSRFRAREIGLLQDRQHVLSSIADRTSMLVLIAIIVVTVLIVPAYAAFLLESRRRRTAEARILALVENAPGAVFQYRRHPDGRDRYEFVTQAATQVRGVRPEDAMADPARVQSSIHPEDHPRVMATVSRSGEALDVLDCEYRVNMPDGEVRWIRTLASPRVQPNGTTLWTGFWIDVTERHALDAQLQEAKEQAEAANRAKSVFLATMSHEIRTPMNGVLGMLELLSMTRLDNEQRATLRVVQESGRSLMRIIDDILDFSKIEAGKLDIRPQPASIKAVIDRVVNIFAGVASSKGLTLSKRFDDRIGPAHAFDAPRLQQVLNNLVSNALKFTTRGGVSIDASLVSRQGGQETIRITVRDTGIGIAAADQGRLFAPFVQVGDAVPAGGTGLGLSICRRLVELMNGRITLESRTGQGTSIDVVLTLAIAELPQLPPPVTATAIEPPEVVGPPDERIVLVVDDHPINRVVLARQVAALGYRVETAANGREAERLWASGRYAALLCDCNMPEMDGYELARRIRTTEERRQVRRTPIIACTANALEGEVANCLEAGMDDYLPKPVSLDALGHKLRAWLPRDEDTPPVDLGVMVEVADSIADQRQVLLRFLECNARDVEDLDRALMTPEPQAAARAAHRMKGAARMIGADPYASACEAVEMAAKRGDGEAMTHGFERMRHELERLDRWIRADVS